MAEMTFTKIKAGVLLLVVIIEFLWYSYWMDTKGHFRRELRKRGWPEAEIDRLVEKYH